MEITDDFYLVLPSNSSALYYPDNATCCYTTYLPREIHLQGDRWSVALVEIHIPNTVEHLEDSETSYTVDGFADEKYNLKPGVYQNLSDFVDMVNEAPGVRGHHAFVPSPFRQGFYMMKRTCNCDSPHTIMFHDKINRILGFDDGFALTTNKIENNTFGGAYHASLSNAIPDQMFIYCDICLPNFVGDTQAPLLRIVTLDRPQYTFGTNTVRQFAPPLYVPLLQQSFQSIVIDIKTSYGQRYPFSQGTLISTLHFKNNR